MPVRAVAPPPTPPPPPPPHPSPPPQPIGGSAWRHRMVTSEETGYSSAIGRRRRRAMCLWPEHDAARSARNRPVSCGWTVWPAADRSCRPNGSRKVRARVSVQRAATYGYQWYSRMEFRLVILVGWTLASAAPAMEARRLYVWADSRPESSSSRREKYSAAESSGCRRSASAARPCCRACVIAGRIGNERAGMKGWSEVILAQRGRRHGNGPKGGRRKSVPKAQFDRRAT